jgi:hypothetical protein
MCTPGDNRKGGSAFIAVECSSLAPTGEIARIAVECSSRRQRELLASPSSAHRRRQWECRARLRGRRLPPSPGSSRLRWDRRRLARCFAIACSTCWRPNSCSAARLLWARQSIRPLFADELPPLARGRMWSCSSQARASHRTPSALRHAQRSPSRSSTARRVARSKRVAVGSVAGESGHIAASAPMNRCGGCAVGVAFGVNGRSRFRASD